MDSDNEISVDSNARSSRFIAEEKRMKTEMAFEIVLQNNAFIITLFTIETVCTIDISFSTTRQTN